MITGPPPVWNDRHKPPPLLFVFLAVVGLAAGRYSGNYGLHFILCVLVAIGSIVAAWLLALVPSLLSGAIFAVALTSIAFVEATGSSKSIWVVVGVLTG